jgi:hypothetical protein
MNAFRAMRKGLRIWLSFNAEGRRDAYLLFYPARGGAIFMFTKRYSHAEMDQWHTAACSTPMSCTSDAMRHNGARAAIAKGQGERAQSQTGSTAMPQTENITPEDWASECLFDCYNS